ncbi:hypothetical protein EV385_2574 [Krasilnikovia cinnamomea]|uniref:Uncharacterized protein n=1 Tax=Krasilnikovia cinnamomea TaxID=349313 RepID=A0A4Q7ZIU8_9ACTN|nr:hypothetical protein [Krasilnikovia cinnamomea]RZU50790.1 hypothetical protein EV385_2574 [Krasilnikovia cinnamomea]
MQRRTATLVRSLIIPAVIAAGGLALATAAQAGTSAARITDHVSEALMPMIGSGTHPVAESDASVALMPMIGSGTHPVAESTGPSWGVGNG